MTIMKVMVDYNIDGWSAPLMHTVHNAYQYKL